MSGWHQLAVCAEYDTDWWFPDLDEPGVDNHGTQAKQVCARCPSIVPCLVEAIERREQHGIWGGAGGDKLRHLRRAYTNPDPAVWAAALAQHLGELDGSVVTIANRNGAAATHGLRVTYNRGCRCRSCRFAAIQDVQKRRPA